jgi:hypothetical protein
LKSNDGAFGCTVVEGGEVRDYSCNQNGQHGCRVEFRSTPRGTSAPAKGR